MRRNVGYSNISCQGHFVGPSDAGNQPTCDLVGMFDIKANAREIGRRIKWARRATAITQEDLAAAVGRSRSTIAGIETGADTGGIEGLIAIADELKVPLDWLLGRQVPAGGPLAGQFVNDPDKLALIRFWDGLDERDRAAALKMLRIDPPDSKSIA